MADAAGLVEKIKKAAIDAQEAAKPVNICFGEVVSESPLQIKIEQKLLLGEGQLILTRNVTDFTVLASIDWETEEEGRPAGREESGKHRHPVTGSKQITVHNGLKAGDRVLIIRQQEGQKFIVADRIRG